MTEQAKHARGEWKAGTTANTWCKVYADGRKVASIHPIHAEGARQKGDFDMEGAITNLIASAPDLLQALKLLEWSNFDMDRHDMYCPACGSTHDQGHQADCVVMLAINKAEGRAKP